MSRHSLLLSVLALVALLAITACDDDPTEPEGETWPADSIRGRVVDQQGNGISGASILLCYDLPYPYRENGTKPPIVIGFTIPEPTLVHIWITEPCEGELVRTLMYEEREAGIHQIIWDGGTVDGLAATEGLYLVHLEADTLSLTTEIFLGLTTYGGYETAENMEVFATTNQYGWFHFGQDCLDFGVEITLVDEHGTPLDPITIPSRVAVWAIHEGHLASSSDAGVAVTPTGGAEVEIVMPTIMP